MGFKLSNSAHLKQNLTSSDWTPMPNETNPFTTQILDAASERGVTKLEFVCFFNGRPIEAEVVVKDISLLTLSHISAVLQYPVIRIRAGYESEKQEERQLWIIAVVIGSGIIIVLCGWCLLFLYYNTCGRPLSRYKPDSVDIVQKEKPPASDYRPNINTEVTQDKPLEHLLLTENRESRSASSPWPEQQMSNTSSTKPLEKNNTEKAIQTTSEEMETTVEHPIPEMAPESSFSSKPEASEPYLERPKSADVRRQSSSLDRSQIVIPEEPVHRWTPYESGDFVASTYSVGYGLNRHPRPLLSSGSGVIELATSRNESRRPS
ncbi:hypothetical protein FO519_001908 [Halicephalobus sp. NKZ332]|nr:hypothetical protein FO519_001908 [Halicephalobus sp. NKZ332]